MPRLAKPLLLLFAVAAWATCKRALAPPDPGTLTGVARAPAELSSGSDVGLVGQAGDLTAPGTGSTPPDGTPVTFADPGLSPNLLDELLGDPALGETFAV